MNVPWKHFFEMLLIFVIKILLVEYFSSSVSISKLNEAIILNKFASLRTESKEMY